METEGLTRILLLGVEIAVVTVMMKVLNMNAMYADRLFVKAALFLVPTVVRLFVVTTHMSVGAAEAITAKIV
jgi:hypothetical protein